MASGKPGVTVSFDKVQKSFGSVRVLEELNLEVKPGEFLVLLGASGSGKTTALRILSGLETASEGRVRIGDRDVTDVLPKYRDISMVFQSYALYPHKNRGGKYWLSPESAKSGQGGNGSCHPRGSGPGPA